MTPQVQRHASLGCVWGSPPTVADVDRIAALTDPVVRNLQITQCYHELSLGLAAMTGNNANWCTFATWASKQVGQTIRREDLTRTFEHLLRTSPEAHVAIARVAATLMKVDPRLDAAGLWQDITRAVTLSSSFAQASDATARGNRKVFEEIAREFARFLAAFPQEAADDAQRIAAFCDGLRPGELPDGQRYLRQAFTRYYRALFEHDAKRRAELMLLGNLEVGLHEQTRLQPEITEALETPVIEADEFARCLLELVFPKPGLLLRLRLLRLLLPPLIGQRTVACARLADRVTAIGRRVVTEHMMTLGLPDGTLLRLGQDLRATFPRTLEQLVDVELRALLRHVDPTPDSLAGSGAEDWSDLPDRMHFITDMFRCCHERRDLLGPPFTPEQVLILKDGRRPPGRL